MNHAAKCSSGGDDAGIFARILFSAGLAMQMAATIFAADAPSIPVVPPPIALPAVPITEPPAGITLQPAPINAPPPPKTAVELEKAVELPPMIIAESSKAPPWHYVAVGDTEYLSRCSAATTSAFVTAQLEIRRMLRVFLPADLLASSSVPAVSVLVPLETGRAADDAVSREMLRPAKQTVRGTNNESPRQRKQAAGQLRFLPNLRLDDRDMLAVFAFLNERDFRRENLIAAPDYVYARLVARTPTLPLWLIEGVSRLYPRSSFRVDPITMEPVRWLSSEDTAGLIRDPESRRVMLPVNELFAPDALSTPENQHPARVAAWQQQAALFVRWALDPANAPAAEPLWRFVRRISQAPATEAIFVECFGFGYADLQERLSDYLPVAVKQPARIPPGRLPPLPRFELKPATPAQIARLRGEWERLEIPFVRRQHPEFLPRYIEQARTTLRRAVGRGDRDPRLFAALGLCELDAGDPSAARSYLEQAVADRVIRPRVYFELARLRWLELIRGVPENNGFTLAELQPILEPLRVASAQSPPLPEVYILMADAWLRCRERVPASDLPALVAATALFRRLPSVSSRVAMVQLREGRRADAIELLGVSAEFATDPAVRTRYQEAITTLKAPPGPTDKNK